MSKSSLVMSVEEYTDTLAKDTVNQVLKMAAIYENEVGSGMGSQFLQAFMTALMGAVVHETLVKSVKGVAKGEKQVGAAMEGLRSIKTQVQDAVGAAFSGGMSTFCGRNVEYFCQVSVVPEPKNKKLC